MTDLTVVSNGNVLDQAKSQNARECLEACHSDKSATNRHIEINKFYISLKEGN